MLSFVSLLKSASPPIQLVIVIVHTHTHTRLPIIFRDRNTRNTHTEKHYSNCLSIQKKINVCVYKVKKNQTGKKTRMTVTDLLLFAVLGIMIVLVVLVIVNRNHQNTLSSDNEKYDVELALLLSKLDSHIESDTKHFTGSEKASTFRNVRDLADVIDVHIQDSDLHTNATTRAATTSFRAGISDRVTGVETEVDSLETSMGAFGTRLGTAETDVDSLETSMGAFGTRLGTAETDVTDVKTRLGTAETNITDVRTRLTTAEASIAVHDTHYQNTDIHFADASEKTTLFSEVARLSLANPAGVDDKNPIDEPNMGVAVMSNSADEDPVFPEVE